MAPDGFKALNEKDGLKLPRAILLAMLRSLSSHDGFQLLSQIGIAHVPALQLGFEAARLVLDALRKSKKPVPVSDLTLVVAAGRGINPDDKPFMRFPCGGRARVCGIRERKIW